MSRRVILYGATGHTGRFIAAEMVRRGWSPVLAGRNIDTTAALATGQDIYAITAPLVCEGVEWVLTGRARATGMVSAGELFDAPAFLGSLSRHLAVNFKQEQFA